MAEPGKPTSKSLHALLVSIEPLDVATKVFVFFLLVSAVFFGLFVIAPASSKKTIKLRASWALKAVSVVHALIVAGASVWALFNEPGMHEITTGVFQRDAEAVRWPLIHARSDVLAAAGPLTLAYFLFDLLLVPVWEGRLVVSVGTWKGEKRAVDLVNLHASYERQALVNQNPHTYFPLLPPLPFIQNSNTSPSSSTTASPSSPGLLASATRPATSSSSAASAWNSPPPSCSTAGSLSKATSTAKITLSTFLTGCS